MVGTETLNLFQRSGWRPKTHSHCRINCEKLVGGWLKSRPSILIAGGIMDEQICSKSFLRNEYYIISAHEDNYLHLTGLHTSLSASKFFEKFYDGTLEETDFDFEKDGQTESEVKGSVRRKINSLPSIMYMFSSGTMVEEDFVKNRIRCALAAGNTSVTLGFVVTGKAKPMTLLKGNELDSSKAKKIDLVLRRETGKQKFEDVIVGNAEMLNTYKDTIAEMVPEELFAEK